MKAGGLVRFIPDRDSRAVAVLIFELFYAFYNGALGLMSASLWLGVSCAYYLLLGTMRFALALRPRAGRGHMGFTGAMLSVLSVVLAAMIYVSLSRSTAAVYGTIVMITIATYTFTKLTLAIYSGVRHRLSAEPRQSSVNAIRLSEAAVSLMTMQQSMIVSFGGMAALSAKILNIFTGTAVWLFIFLLGLWLIRKSMKGKKENEKEN